MAIVLINIENDVLEFWINIAIIVIMVLAGIITTLVYIQKKELYKPSMLNAVILNVFITISSYILFIMLGMIKIPIFSILSLLMPLEFLLTLLFVFLIYRIDIRETLELSVIITLVRFAVVFILPSFIVVIIATYY